MATVEMDEPAIGILRIPDENNIAVIKITEPISPAVIKIVSEGPIGPSGSSEVDLTNYLIHYELAKG